jgi:peptidoglycan/LPS O-acetylase OafA/YrhL
MMPAFWAALVVVAFGFAPLMYYLQNGTLHGFLIYNPGGPIDYIRHNFGLNIGQYDVSGLTKDIPWPHAFNGSLWTLIYEATGYVLVAAFGVFGIFKKHSKIALGSLLALFGLYVLDQAIPGVAGNLLPVFRDAQLLPLMLFFFAGATWYLYRDKIPLSNKYFVLASILYVLSLRYGFYALAGPVTFTYAVFYLATHFPIKSFDRKADLSYGIYIYAFPVQQLLSQLGVQGAGVWVYSLAATGLTLPLAFTSYFLIEKPALRLKSAQLRIRRKK